MALEDWLGVQLFHRSTRHVHLTDAGQGYLGRCMKVLEEVRELEHTGHDAQGGLSGKIRISAPVFFGRHHIAPVLAKFLLTNPGLNAELFLSDRLVDLVGEGFDLAIRVTEPEDSSLIARRLTSVRLCVVGAPAYLAEHGTPTELAELKNHDCIIDRVPEGSDKRIFATLDGKSNQRTSGQIRVNDGETARNFAIAGLGLARLPFFFVEDAVASGDLVEIELKDDSEEAGLYVMYPPSRYLSRNIRVLADLLIAQMEK